MITNPLSDFVTERYRRAGVAEHCLRLQNSIEADINMLLSAAWLAEQNRCWQRDQVRQLIGVCANWRERCVLPLRAVRRNLKNERGTAAFYTRIKALELDAEMHQLHLLHTMLQDMTLQTSRAAHTDALAINLSIYFDAIAAPPTIVATDGKALIEALHRSG